MTILSVKNIRKKFGNQEVLKGINFEINEAKIYALIGPNGSGKTTLFNIISNLMKADEGEVEVVGKKNTDTDIYYEVSFLKDNRVLYEYLTGYDHLSFIRAAQKLPKERIDFVINRLQIAHYMNKKVGEYSLGMKQQLLIAMAMMNNPKLMILDEPLNGLDPTAVIKVRYLFKQMVKEGTAILISSHTLSEIDLLADKIMFLKDGQILEEDFNLENIYEIIVSENDIDKLSDLNLENFDFNFDKNKIFINLKDKSISDILDKIYKLNIEIIEINKKKIGSEEKYMSIFPEEMLKIKDIIDA